GPRLARGELKGCGKCKLQTDEADIGNDSVRMLRHVRARKIARVQSFYGNDSAVGGDPVVQLPVTDIDGIDTVGTAFQQHLSESTGGRADIQADAPFRRQSEVIESRGKFDAAA